MALIDLKLKNLAIFLHVNQMKDDSWSRDFAGKPNEPSRMTLELGSSSFHVNGPEGYKGNFQLLFSLTILGN